jgi:hypothetical protein
MSSRLKTCSFNQMAIGDVANAAATTFANTCGREERSLSMPVRVEGLSNLVASLEALPKATARNTLRSVLKKAATPVRDAIEARAPELTGTLKRSILIGNKLTSRQAREAKQDGKFFAETYVGTADPAGIPQEFGTFKEASTAVWSTRMGSYAGSVPRNHFK